MAITYEYLEATAKEYEKCIAIAREIYELRKANNPGKEITWEEECSLLEEAWLNYKQGEAK